MTLSFHQLTLFDREAMQAVMLHSGRRNCNYTFANLVGWQFWYYTEVCVLEKLKSATTKIMRIVYCVFFAY